jgi:NTE family protein
LLGSEDVQLPAGAVVLEEGSPSSCMYFLIEGTLCITKSAVEIARLETGHMIGELGAITGEPRTAGAVTLAAVRLLRVAAERFLAVVDRFPEVCVGA